MKKILAGILLFLSVRAAVSSEPAVCALIRKKYTSTAFIRTDFTQKIYWSVREKTSKKRGSLSLAPGNKFRVTLGNDTYVSNGNTVWHYNRNNGQVVIRNVSDINLASLPAHILTTFFANWTFSEKRRSGSSVVLAGKADSISAENYRSLAVTADASDGTVSKLVITDNNNNIHTYILSKTSFGEKIADTTFEFEAPPDAHTIDKRN